MISLFFAENKFRIAAPLIAVPLSLRAFGPVLPYILIFMLIWLFYKYALDTNMNEFTAPVMMPVILLMMVLFDKLRHEPAPIPAMGQWDQTLDHKPTAQQTAASSERSLLTAPDSPLRQYGFFKALHLSTSETVGHIGALVILMALSSVWAAFRTH